jgi:phosphoserine phosphatase
VFAIEADVRWSWQFAEKLYETKPRNLTWIFDRAENVADVLKLHTDVAIVVTGSDDIWLREIAAKMADDVILPWQQYNGGKAVVSTGGLSFDE